MTAPVRFGVLGCGRIVRKLIPGVLSTPAASLRAVASQRPGIAEALLSEMLPRQASGHAARPKAYDSYEALIADPEVDAVYIPATGEQHRPWTLAAARAGKHVLCEKPLALSVAEAEEMTAACRKAGVLLQEAFMWRHHPRARRTYELLRSGAIGRLRLINAGFSFNIDRRDWRMRPERGGGAMWDVGCYGVNAARFFAGDEPTDIHARAHFTDTGVDMTMQIALRFPGDVLANIDCSFEAPFRCSLELVGDAGRMELPVAFLHTLPVIHLWPTCEREAEPEVVTCEDISPYACQVQSFCESIAAGQLLPPAEDGVANMRVLETALQIATSAG